MRVWAVVASAPASLVPELLPLDPELPELLAPELLAPELLAPELLAPELLAAAPSVPPSSPAGLDPDELELQPYIPAATASPTEPAATYPPCACFHMMASTPFG